MSKDDNMTLTCRQCGKQFVFTKAEQEFYELKGFMVPSRCKECRSTAQSQLHTLVCSQCKTELERGTPIYCGNCLDNAGIELEQKIEQKQKSASAMHTKLLAVEARKAELAESLRQREQLIAELEAKVSSLRQDLDEADKFNASLSWLPPVLDGIQERLKTLEKSHALTNERMLQVVERIHELHENTSLMDILKRSLKQYRSQDA